MSGVMPIIFAHHRLSAGYHRRVRGVGHHHRGLWRRPDAGVRYWGLLYSVIYFLLILSFVTFTHHAVQPHQVARANLKKNGGFIPARPGKPTADFIP